MTKPVVEKPEATPLNPYTEITPELVAEHGLSEEEYATILRALNREPSGTELGIFSAMWSEHCSYKSSKVWLKTLPTEGPQVIQGPGENAGVVDIGDGQAAIFKMESHNHPSYIEPYQGAATGVGGILRDVFTMGARPIALVNALRFGDPSHPKTRSLVAGVVAGIGGYVCGHLSRPSNPNNAQPGSQKTAGIPLQLCRGEVVENEQSPPTRGDCLLDSLRICGAVL